jgi:hypothetical protein
VELYQLKKVAAWFQSMVQGMHCGKRFVPKKNVASKFGGGKSSL